METRAIPEDQWIEYFDRFSREHLGYMVTIEVLDREVGPQRVAQDLPLEGSSFDHKGTRPTTIEISAGDRADQHVSHLIDMPLHIREAQQGNGDIDVQIEPATGPVTLVHVRGPMQ